MTTKLKALPKRVIVKRVPNGEIVRNGIIVKENDFRFGTVIAVGDGVREVKEGDKIAFDNWNDSDITFEGESFVVLEEKNIMGVMIDG